MTDLVNFSDMKKYPKKQKLDQGEFPWPRNVFFNDQYEQITAYAAVSEAPVTDL